MAMTKEEYNNKLKRISELSNDNEEVMSIAREIQAELDSYNEKEYYEENQVYDTDGRLWAEKYQEVKKEYRDKFFSTPSEAIENQKKITIQQMLALRIYLIIVKVTINIKEENYAKNSRN